MMLGERGFCLLVENTRRTISAVVAVRVPFGCTSIFKDVELVGAKLSSMTITDEFYTCPTESGCEHIVTSTLTIGMDSPSIGPSSYVLRWSNTGNAHFTGGIRVDVLRK